MPSWLTPGSKDGVRARDCNFTGLIKQFPDSLLGDSWEDSVCWFMKAANKIACGIRAVGKDEKFLKKSSAIRVEL